MGIMLLMFWMMMIGAMMIRGCFWQGGDVLTQRACNPVRESLTNSLSITAVHRGGEEDHHHHEEEVEEEDIYDED